MNLRLVTAWLHVTNVLHTQTGWCREKDHRPIPPWSSMILHGRTDDYIHLDAKRRSSHANTQQFGRYQGSRVGDFNQTNVRATTSTPQEIYHVDKVSSQRLPSTGPLPTSTSTSTSTTSTSTTSTSTSTECHLPDLPDLPDLQHLALLVTIGTGTRRRRPSLPSSCASPLDYSPESAEVDGNTRG